MLLFTSKFAAANIKYGSYSFEMGKKKQLRVPFILLLMLLSELAHMPL